MCGIVGMISRTPGGFNYPEVDFFTNMLTFDAIRGPDSTGVFGVSAENKIDLMKGNADGYTFVRTANYQRWKTKMFQKYRIVIGHNRKATKGSISPQNAHPFQEKHITLVHNGTLFNQEALNKDVEVDSHAIAHALADGEANEALKKLHGAFALVWHDANKKTLNVCRNTERPLSIVQYESMWAISSEVGLPLWLWNRTGKKSIKIIDVPSDQILIFPLDDLSADPEEIPYEKYSSFSYNRPERYYPSVRHVDPVVDLTRRRWPHNSSGGPESVASGAAVVVGDKLAFKQNQEIMVKLIDRKEEDDLTCTLFFNPVIDGIQDTNIMCRASLSPTDLRSPFEAQDTWFGTIKHWTFAGKMPLISLRDLKPCYKSVTATGEMFEHSKLIEAGNEGCCRCTVKIPPHDFGKSIFRFGKNKEMLALCPLCVDEGKKRAKFKEKETNAS